MRVLVVEDDARVASFVARGLRQEGFAVDVATDGRDAFHQALVEPYDLIVLDIVIPQLDGLEVLEQIRKHGCQVPVLVLSARDGVEDRVRGLDRGADDYLVKPFSFSELTARVRALLRRPSDLGQAVARVGDLEVDLAGRKVTRGGQPIALTTRGYRFRPFNRLIRGVTTISASESPSH